MIKLEALRVHTKHEKGECVVAVEMRDEDGKEHITCLSCKKNYEASVIKALGRLVPVRVKREEEDEERK